MLECFRLHRDAPEIVPGRLERPWMDAFQERFPYKCLPLNMANTTGWEVLCPFTFSATWSGDKGVDAIEIKAEAGVEHPEFFVTSHFSHGVLTFHPGYLFRTAPGFDLLASGTPNHFKHGIQAMTGLIETDWLPYPFTMNWVFTGPGEVVFERGEPFCFISVVGHHSQDVIEPIVADISSDPELSARYDAWMAERQANGMKQGWSYFRGTPPQGGGPAPQDHINKRRLKCPITGATP